jgi:hypothetical protein
MVAEDMFRERVLLPWVTIADIRVRELNVLRWADWRGVKVKIIIALLSVINVEGPLKDLNLWLWATSLGNPTRGPNQSLSVMWLVNCPKMPFRSPLAPMPDNRTNLLNQWLWVITLATIYRGLILWLLATSLAGGIKEPNLSALVSGVVVYIRELNRWLLETKAAIGIKDPIVWL